MTLETFFYYVGLTCLVLFGLWFLIQFKSWRPDGKLVKNVHRYRKVLWYMMPGENQGVVYFDEYVDAEPLLNWLEKNKVSNSLTHAVVAAAAIGLRETPVLNRFIAGNRLYDRNDIFLTFTMKRKKLNQEAAISAVKLQIKPGMTFEDLSIDTTKNIKLNRSGEKTYNDKELGILSLFPRAVFAAFIAFARQMNSWNLLPGGFMKADPMFTSIFIANLGSLNMNAGYHHLYSWGNCPLFMMVGKVQDKPVVKDGEIKIQKTLHIRYTFDERIDDGLNANEGIKAVTDVLLHPDRDLGCLLDDRSDFHDISIPRSERIAQSAA